MPSPIISKITNNWGVLCAGIILLILLVLNYNRCYSIPTIPIQLLGLESKPETIGVSPLSMETFAVQGDQSINVVPITGTKGDAASTSVTDANANTCCIGSFPPPINVHIDVTPTTCTVHFAITLNAGVPIPQKILAVLAKFDKSKNQVGSTNIYLSDEYTLNNTQALNPATNQNMCMIFNGIPSCKYTFTDLLGKDINGDSYFYKLGLSAIYSNGNSAFVLPGNITSDYFVLDTNINLQTAQYTEFLNYKATQNAQDAAASAIGAGGSANYSGTMANATGQYEMMKQQLGNYPNNLEISDETMRTGALADLVDKSMALGKIIVNVTSG